MTAKLKEQNKIAPKVKASTAVVFDLDGSATRLKQIEKDLDKNALKIKPLLDEQADLKKNIVAHVNATRGDDEEVEIRTPLGDVKIGKKGSDREITDLEKAIEFLGTETFMKIAKIGLGDLDKYLTPEEVAQVVESRRTDARRIT